MSLTTLDHAIARVAATVTRLRADRGLPMGPPLPETEIARTEASLGVRLPEDLRRFLLEIGNGMRGPQYQLHPLQTMIEESDKTIYTLADPFEPPLSSAESVERAAPGVLITNHEGCAFYSGLVVSGPERGNMWGYSDGNPGWTPRVASFSDLVEEDGSLFQPITSGWGDDAYYRRLQDCLLAERNRGLRMTFLEWIEREWLGPMTG